MKAVSLTLPKARVDKAIARAAGLLVGIAMPALASAQSSVNISGYLDIGVFRDTTPKWNVGTIQRSNLAFSGTEDLGGGLSAFFRLSTRFDLDTGQSEGVGSKPFFHDESTVGLKGSLGSIKFGRALDAMYAYDWNFDPWYYFDRVASPAWDLWHYNFPSDPQANSGRGDYGRLNNGVFYVSPTYGGFTVRLSGSPEKRDGDKSRGAGGSIVYSQAGYSAMLAHERNSAASTDTFVGLKGSFAGLGVMGAYDLSKAGTSTARTYTAGLQYTIGGLTTLNAGWGKVNVDGVQAERVISAGAIYALSKRTNVYADVANKRYPSDSKYTYGVGIAHGF